MTLQQATRVIISVYDVTTEYPELEFACDILDQYESSPEELGDMNLRWDDNEPDTP